mmetsp:Transcript_28634/g.65447  ORF Transcript_28634/g.65447 Transcript_28634/m.65447 type:complete len:333 (-) Transcript_28634:392-1390(-)
MIVSPGAIFHQFIIIRKVDPVFVISLDGESCMSRTGRVLNVHIYKLHARPLLSSCCNVCLKFHGFVPEVHKLMRHLEGQVFLGPLNDGKIVGHENSIGRRFIFDIPPILVGMHPVHEEGMFHSPFDRDCGPFLLRGDVIVAPAPEIHENGPSKSVGHLHLLRLDVKFSMHVRGPFPGGSRGDIVSVRVDPHGVSLPHHPGGKLQEDDLPGSGVVSRRLPAGPGEIDPDRAACPRSVGGDDAVDRLHGAVWGHLLGRDGFEEKFFAVEQGLVEGVVHGSGGRGKDGVDAGREKDIDLGQQGVARGKRLIHSVQYVGSPQLVKLGGSGGVLEHI